MRVRNLIPIQSSNSNDARTHCMINALEFKCIEQACSGMKLNG